MQFIQEHTRTLFSFFCIILVVACSNPTPNPVEQTSSRDTLNEVNHGLGYRKDKVERKISDRVDDIGDYLKRLDTVGELNQLSEQARKQYIDDLKRLKQNFADLKIDIENGEDQVNERISQRMRLIEDELMQIKMQIDEKTVRQK